MDALSLKMLLAGASSLSGEEYIGTYGFYTPEDYTTFTWTVPANVVYIQAFCLGSGGLNDGYPNTFPGGDGGGGGCSIAVIPVTAGESLNLGIGTSDPSNNAASSQSFGGSGGGFSGIFRGSTPLIIAGGGGGGQVNDTNYGGAGGGLQAQSSSDGYPGGGQSPGNFGSEYLSSGVGGGGGYYGGAGNSGSASSGGSGYIGSSGILHAQTATGNGRLIPSLASNNTDYLNAPSNPPSGLAFGYGGIGNNSGAYSHGSGLIVIHTLGTGYNPASPPEIPNPRNILATY